MNHVDFDSALFVLMPDQTEMVSGGSRKRNDEPPPPAPQPPQGGSTVVPGDTGSHGFE